LISGIVLCYSINKLTYLLTVKVAYNGAGSSMHKHRAVETDLFNK